MSKLLDPAVCPDCRAPLDTDALCSGCGLAIRGPLAHELWTVMVSADALVERLRVLSPAGTGTATGTRPAPAAHPASGPETREIPYPHPPVPVPGAVRSRRLPALTVPVLLLSLGALLLLVAAVVFVAVAWTLMPLAVRAIILIGLTVVLAVVASQLTRRRLRGSAEALWVVVAGMATLDWLAGTDAGLLGLDSLSSRTVANVLGVLLLSLGAGVAEWSRRHGPGALVGMQLVATLGVLLLCVQQLTYGDPVELWATLLVPPLVALAITAGHRLLVLTVAAGAFAATSWGVVVLEGLARAGEVSGTAQWWGELAFWPLLVAAAYAAVPTLPVVGRRLPSPENRLVAVVAATVSLALLSAAVLLPGARDVTLLAVELAAALLVLAGLTRRSGPWGHAAAVLSALGSSLAGLWVLADAVEVVATTSAAPVAAWVSVLLALAGVVGALAVSARVPGSGAASAVAGGAPALAAVGVGSMLVRLGAATTLAFTAWTVLGVLALTASVVLTARLRSTVGRVVGLAGALVLAGLALLQADGSTVLEAWLASVVSVACLVLVARERRTGQAGQVVHATLATAAGFVALDRWAALPPLAPEAIAMGVACVAVVVGAGIGAAPWSLRQPLARAAVEGVALAAGLVACVVVAPDARWTALSLTVVGTGVALASALHEDRAALSWLAVVLLGVATAVRVVEGVRAPEVVTLPAAALLLAVGLWRMSRDAELDSLPALGSGLALALLPSLLITLDEPVGLRGMLVALGALMTLGVGVGQRWSAPFLAGAVSVALLALVHLGPVAQYVPRFLVIALAGSLLLVVGVTWESRRRDLAHAARYLTALR